MTVKGIDWGGYDYKLQLKSCRDLAGIQFVISQSGGVGTPSILQEAKSLGLITGLYYWNSALISVAAQIAEFSTQIDSLNPDFIVLDFEHWWADWNQYWQAIDGKLPWDQVKKMPPDKISENGRLVMEGLKSKYPNKYLLLYSADWFIRGYAPMSVNWIKNYPYFPATYPDYGVPPYTLSFADIKAGKIMTKLGMRTIDMFSPDLSGLPGYDIWQYSSRIKIPGEAYAYDWDEFDGTLEELKMKCGLIPPKPPTLTWEQEIDAWARTMGYNGVKP